MHENYAICTLEKLEKQKWESREAAKQQQTVCTNADSMTARLLYLAQEEV